jgi:hypothetical protein
VLETHPSSGHCYFSVPFDVIPYAATLLANGLLRFISLYGPALSCSKSYCRSLHLSRAVDLAEL